MKPFESPAGQAQADTARQNRDAAGSTLSLADVQAQMARIFQAAPPRKGPSHE